MTEICELCSNKFPNEMMINKNYCAFNQCYDCLFSMSFNDKNILNGSMGIKLKDYIELSKKYHTEFNEIPCKRLNDSGGCYVCMKLLDIPFDIPDDNNDLSNDNLSNDNINSNIINTNKTEIEYDKIIKNTNDYQTHILMINDNDLFDKDKFILTL